MLVNLKYCRSLPPLLLPPTHNVPGDSMWSQQFMEKLAVTIKKGFALPQKELTVFNGDTGVSSHPFKTASKQIQQV